MVNSTDTVTAKTAAPLRDLLAGLATERVNETYPNLDALSTVDLVEAMNREDATVTDAVAAVKPEIGAAIDGIVTQLSTGGRLIYIGAGTAGRLGILDASETPPTFGTDPSLVVGVIAGGPNAVHTAVENAEDNAEAGAADLRALHLSNGDAVVGVSASGRTPYVLGALAYARSLGAFTVGLSCNAQSPLGRAGDVAIEVEVGPEILTGSTRLKAGTAQKMVLNMLSTIAMVRLGKTYRNLMVDMRATNEKLRARAERTVMLATDADSASAVQALGLANGSVKVAILTLTTGVDVQSAHRLLEEHHGNLSTAVGGLLHG